MITDNDEFICDACKISLHHGKTLRMRDAAIIFRAAVNIKNAAWTTIFKNDMDLCHSCAIIFTEKLNPENIAQTLGLKS